MRVAVVQGTRPEIAKNRSIVQALRVSGVPFEVFHTGQHVQVDMSDEVYADMGYRPDRIFPGPYRLGGVIDWLHAALKETRFSAVIVNGDTAAALAGALAGMYAGVPVSHVEAGLRSRDPFMLEERNRIMVDAVAEHLFAYTSYEVDVLRSSPDVRGTIHLAGNTTVDLLHELGDRLVLPNHLAPQGREPYLLATLHRKELTDSSERMRAVFGALARLANAGLRVLFPMHPRTTDAMARAGLSRSLLGRVEVVPPVGVLAALALQRHAAAVLTDSGCIQEEAYLLGTPCVTVRENTERHLTLLHGANVLTGFDPDAVVDSALAAVSGPRAGWPDIYGAPGVGQRVVDIVIGGRPLPSTSGRQSAATASS